MGFRVITAFAILWGCLGHAADNQLAEEQRLRREISFLEMEASAYYADYFEHHRRRDLQLAFETHFRACLEFSNDHSCGQLHHLIENKNENSSNHLLQRVAKLLRARCDEGRMESCEQWGRFLEDRGDLLAAAEIFRGVCQISPKLGCGIGALIMQKLGFLREAHEMSYRSCKANFNCAFELRYISAHPRREEIVRMTERNCLLQAPYAEGRELGANACTVYGSYLFKSGQVEKAYSIVGMDCTLGNETSCLLAVAMATRATVQGRGIASINDFCFPKQRPSLRHLSSERLRSKYCPSQPASGVPPGILQYSSNLLDGFLEEQEAF